MIERKTIENLAQLSRIRLTEGEVQTLEKELSGILDYVSALQKVDTSDIPREGVPGLLRNVARKDEAKERADSEAILNEAPIREGGYFAVKKVIEYER